MNPINRRIVSHQSFRITIPLDYNHESQFDDSFNAILRSMAKKDEKYLIPPPRDLPKRHFTNERFGQVTHKLVPRKTYKVILFDIDGENGEEISTQDCLAFLRKRKSYLVGAHGLTIIQQLLDLDELSRHFSGILMSFDDPALIPAIPGITARYSDQKEWGWNVPLHACYDPSGPCEDLFVSSTKFISFED